MSRPKNNGAVKRLKDMTDAQRVWACEFGIDAIEKPQVFFDAMAFLSAIKGGILNFDENATCSVNVSVEVKPSKLDSELPSNKGCSDMIVTPFNRLFNRIIEKTIVAIKTGDVSFFKDLAQIIENQSGLCGSNDALRSWLFRHLKSCRSDLGMKTALPPQTIEEIYQAVPESFKTEHQDYRTFKRQIAEYCKQLGIKIKKSAPGRRSKTK